MFTLPYLTFINQLTEHSIKPTAKIKNHLLRNELLVGIKIQACAE